MMTNYMYFSLQVQVTNPDQKFWWFPFQVTNGGAHTYFTFHHRDQRHQDSNTYQYSETRIMLVKDNRQTNGLTMLGEIAGINRNITLENFLDDGAYFLVVEREPSDKSPSFVVSTYGSSTIEMQELSPD